MVLRKIVVFLAIVAIPILSLIINTNRWGVYATRINQINFCLFDNQIPCRWINNLGTAYGSPVFNYTAPLPFYVGELFYHLTTNFGLSVKLMMVLPMILSLGLVAYLYRKLWLLLIVSIVYAALYFVNDSIAWVWSLPFYLLLIHTFVSPQKNRILTRIMYFATSLFMIIMVQKEAVLYFLPALLILLVVRAKASMRKILHLLLALVLALLMSATYWLPMVVESPFVRVENGEYIPVWAEGTVDRLPSERVEVLTGDSHITGFKEGTNWFSMHVTTKSHSIIRLAIYYFPDWTITANGKEIKNYYTNNSQGFMTMILGEGDYTIEGHLLNTPVRTIANIISGIGLVGYGLLVIFVLGRTRKFMMYYIDAFGR